MNANLAISYADVPGFPAGSAVAAIVASITDTSLTPPTSLTQSGTPSSRSCGRYLACSCRREEACKDKVTRKMKRK